MKLFNYCAAVISTAFLFSCGTREEKPEAAETIKEEVHPDKMLLEEALTYFQTLPDQAVSDSNAITNEKVLLGKTLFYDNRLSKNNTQSCNSCHNLATFGVDREATSEGDLKQRGNRNSPTVYNAALHISQFWDGRAKNVEEQAGMPVTNPVEMNMPSEKYVVDRLKKIEGYKNLFASAFPGEKNPVTYSNLKKAIAVFERTLITPGNFNKFLGGDPGALSPDEKRGLKVFMEVGCTTCHNGKALGGSMLQKFPLIGAEYKSLTGSKKEDLGKMEVTKEESDKFVFKVPSLINVSETGPYFHDGSVVELETAVRIMAKLQLNKELSDDQVKSIKVFLEGLKGEIPGDAITPPEMPK